VGYLIYPIDLVFVSKYADLFIWFWGTIAGATLAFLVALLNRKQVRWAYLLLSASMALPIAVYLNQQPLAAYSASLILPVSFLAITTIFARRLRLKPQRGGMVTALGILLILTVVELASVFRNVQRIWAPSLPLIDLQAQLSGLAFNFSTPIMLVALFSWIAAVLLVFRNLRRGSFQETVNERDRITKVASLLLLLIAVLLSFLIALSPYASGSLLRGVDTRSYYTELSAIRSLTDSLAHFRVDYKALVLFFFYGMEAATGWSPYLVTIAGPAALAALLVIVTFAFILGVTKNWLAAGVAGILAAASFQVIVGLLAGIFANLLAVSFMLPVFYFLSTPLNKLRVALMVLVSYAVLFAHVWTWGIMMVAVGASVILNVSLWLVARKNSALKSSIVAHSLLLLCGAIPVIAAYLASYLNLLSGGIASSFSDALQTESGSVNLAHLNSIVPTLTVTLKLYVGATFAYPLTLTLTILGIIYLTKTNLRAIGPLVGLWAVTSVGTLLLTSEYQWRLLYLIPFQALAATGLIGLLKLLELSAARVGIDPTTRTVRLLEAMIVAVILIDSANYALIAASYLPVS